MRAAARWFAGILGFFVFPAIGLGAGMLATSEVLKALKHPGGMFDVLPAILGGFFAIVGVVGGLSAARRLAYWAFRARDGRVRVSGRSFCEVCR